MNFILTMTPFGTQYRKPPFIALLATAGVVGYWAVRLLSPLPAPLPSEPIAATVVSTGQPLQPAELWLTAATPQTSKIKLLAIIGSPSGQGRAVFNVDGQSVAGSTGENPLPGWRIVAVRPVTVDLEIDGKIQTLSQPQPLSAQ